MSVDVSGKSLPDLRRIVINHRLQNRTDLPLCRAASDEIERRRGGPLNLWTTLAAIRAAAEQHHFLTYLDVAKANGVTWSQARVRMTPHLNELLDYAIDRSWPLVTALVVDAAGVAEGKMSETALKGFTKSADEREKFPGGDEAEFLQQEQGLVFAWADKERGRDLRA